MRNGSAGFVDPDGGDPPVLFCPWYRTVMMVGGYRPAQVRPTGDQRRATEQA